MTDPNAPETESESAADAGSEVEQVDERCERCERRLVRLAPAETDRSVLICMRCGHVVRYEPPFEDDPEPEPES